MEFFWGIVSGYTYCAQSAASDFVTYPAAEASTISRFRLQVLGAVLLVVALITFFHTTRRSASFKEAVVGTLIGAGLTIIAGLILTFAIWNAQGFDPWLSRYAFGVGIYTVGYTVALVALTASLLLRRVGIENRFLRHTAIFFFAFLTLNWTVYTGALIFCQ